MLLRVRWRRRKRSDKGVELSIADLLPKKFVSFPPKNEVVRLRSTQQPAALTVKRLFECNRPCTDWKCHVAHKQRKLLNVAVTPRVSSNQGVELCAECSKFMQRSAWLARTKVHRYGLDFRVSASLKLQWQVDIVKEKLSKCSWPEPRATRLAQTLWLFFFVFFCGLAISIVKINATQSEQKLHRSGCSCPRWLGVWGRS